MASVGVQGEWLFTLAQPIYSCELRAYIASYLEV